MIDATGFAATADALGRPEAIRRTGPVPYYAQLAEILRRGIAAGRRSPGELLPAEAELCRAYGLSRTVVRQALDELVAEGLVRKRKGRGTIVAGGKVAELVVQELRGFADEMGARGHAVRTRVERLGIVDAPPEVAAELGLRGRARAVRLARVREVDGEPVVSVETFLPAGRFGRLVRMDLGERSLYAVLAEEFGVEPRAGSRRIEAAVATRELADALGVTVGSPVLALTAVSVDQHGAPFEFFRAAYRGDRTAFEVTVSPPARRRAAR